MKNYREAWNTVSRRHRAARAAEWLDGFSEPEYTTFDESDHAFYNVRVVKR